MILILWAIFSVMVALAVAGLTIPLVRRYDRQVDTRDAVATILRDQLAEVDGQAATGQIAASEADALRMEIKRRLLAEHNTRSLPSRLLSEPALARSAVAISILIALGATAIYALRGRPDLIAPSPVEGSVATAAQGERDSQIASAIAALEARTAKAPNDPESWRMLGWSYFQTQRYADAARAYTQAFRLRPDGDGYASALGEALVQAAKGIVTPDAERAFTMAVALDREDPRARYFLALGRDQHGDRSGAIDDWLRLLAEAPADAPWAPELRRYVEQTARTAGIDISQRLANISSPPATAGTPKTGPTTADVAAVAAMPPEAQQAFIRTMVDRLVARLKKTPRDADGWLQLIRARKALGDDQGARAALRDSRIIFADQPVIRGKLVEAAAKLGVS